jgi:two-component system NtrC family sensor kinase
MDGRMPDLRGGSIRPQPAWQDLLGLARRILHYANIRVPRNVFLRKLCQLTLTTAGCDALALTRMQGGALRYQCRAESLPDGEVHFQSRYFKGAEEIAPEFGPEDDSVLGPVRRQVLDSALRSGAPGITASGSFWTDDVIGLAATAAGATRASHSHPPRQVFPSAALIRFEIEERNYGLLELRSRHPAFFDRETVEFYECIAQFIGIAIADRRARSALCQRVNELTCLNEMTQLERSDGIDLDELLQRIVRLLPSAFPFPGRTQAQLRLDEGVYSTPGFPPGAATLTSPLAVGDLPRGEVKVVYQGEEDELDLHSSLTEGQNLLNSLARQISLLIERRRAAEEHLRLQEQLRHADRLATIGQLAAGVAHELNEPLANILGFAQLAAQDEALPEQAARDLGKIINAAIHGREIVKKLLIFSRQMPTQMRPLDLNQVVTEALYILESRCAREGIELVRELAPDLPQVSADPAQVQQVLVNLVVNAIQAMSSGGRLTITTATGEEAVVLCVADTGSGMSEIVRQQAFVPFFTTKDVGQGTGLGLAVVHGIVIAHGGTITVESREGEGSVFTVTLPLNAIPDAREDD